MSFGGSSSPGISWFSAIEVMEMEAAPPKLMELYQLTPVADLACIPVSNSQGEQDQFGIMVSFGDYNSHPGIFQPASPLAAWIQGGSMRWIRTVWDTHKGEGGEDESNQFRGTGLLLQLRFQLPLGRDKTQVKLFTPLPWPHRQGGSCTLGG